MSATTEPARVVPWLPVLGWCALAATPATVALLRGDEDLTIGAVLAAVVLGTSVASALDDPARVTTAAVPVPVTHRRAARLAWALLPVLITAAALSLAVATGDHVVGADRGHLAVVGLATALGSLAVVAHLPDDAGFGAPGTAASAATLMGVLVMTALAQRFSWLPMPGDAAHTERWWVVCAIAVVVALPLARDPAARPLAAR